MYVNKHCVFHCIKSKTIHGSTPVQTIMYISITKGLCTLSMAPRKDHAKSRKSDLPYVTNSLNILLYDVF